MKTLKRNSKKIFFLNSVLDEKPQDERIIIFCRKRILEMLKDNEQYELAAQTLNTWGKRGDAAMYSMLAAEKYEAKARFNDAIRVLESVDAQLQQPDRLARLYEMLAEKEEPKINFQKAADHYAMAGKAAKDVDMFDKAFSCLKKSGFTGIEPKWKSLKIDKMIAEGKEN